MAGVLRCDYYYVCCDVGKSTAFAISMILSAGRVREQITDERADQARRIHSNVREFEPVWGKSGLVHLHVNVTKQWRSILFVLGTFPAEVA